MVIDTRRVDIFLENLFAFGDYINSIHNLGIFRGNFKFFNMVFEQTQLINPRQTFFRYLISLLIRGFPFRY